MRFLELFFGPPTEDKFARLVMKTLRQVGDQRQATYDKNEFRITFSEAGENAGMLNLRNLYIEYCAVAASERAALLRRNCIGLARHFDVPEDFEDARPDLLPTVRPRSMSEIMRLDVELRGSTWTELAASPLSEHLEVCLVYDLPTTIEFVNKEMLGKWGISLYEAGEVARRNLEQREFAAAKLGEHLFVFLTGDAFDATRMLLLDPIRSLGAAGPPVAVPLNRDSLLVTGADDVEGLGMLAALIEQNEDEARPICPIPHKLVGDEWEAWLPPPDHAHHDKFKQIELNYLLGEHAEQKLLLDKRLEQTGEDAFIATFSIAERDGKTLSFSIWSKGVPTWLPKTDFVGLYDSESKHADFVAWDRLEAAVGYLMTPLECYPPRWLVDGFPTREEIAQLSPEDWKESS